MAKPGRSFHSYKKHELFAQIAQAQWAIALKVPAFRSLAIIDMHAGDGIGVESDQADFFMPNESHATPALAVSLMQTAEFGGKRCLVYLYEKNRAARLKLERRFNLRNVSILADHANVAQLDFSKFDYVLVFNDPNGPGKHGDATLLQIAHRVRKADFLINVNEGTLTRIEGLTRPNTESDSIHARAFKSKDIHLWRLNAIEWAKFLGRKHALVCKHTYGNRGMKGRIILVTNYPCNPPRTFQQLSVFERDTMDPGRPTARSPEEPPYRHPTRRN